MTYQAKGPNGIAIATRRKYAGAWVPVVIFNGKRQSLTHVATSGDAAEMAIKRARQLTGEKDPHA